MKKFLFGVFMRKIIIGMIAGAIIMMVWCCKNGAFVGDDVCPKCKSDSIKEVIYGLLTPEERANPDSFYNALRQQGKVYGGGCVVDDESVRFICYSCGHRW